VANSAGRRAGFLNREVIMSDRHRSSTTALSVAAFMLTGAALAADGATSNLPSGVPDFSSNNMAWASDGVEFLPIPGEKFKAVTNDPAHPYCGNRIRPECGNQFSEPVADIANPILQPWVVAQMKRTNADILAGKPSFEAMSRCWPGGVPGLMLFTAEPTYFLQTPQEVTIVHTRGNNIRHIYMNVPHSKNPPLTWLGESVGHYEGDELVIDTIGMNDKSFVDSYRTPHTSQLHVVERFKLLDGGKALEVDFTVEDAGAFNMPWSASKRWKRVQAPLAEEACAENNADYFSYEVEPLQQAQRPDF
jgi:hypothetical protein